MMLLEIFVSFCIVVGDTRRPFSSAAVLDDMGNNLILDIPCFHFSLMGSFSLKYHYYNSIQITVPGVNGVLGAHALQLVALLK